MTASNDVNRPSVATTEMNMQQHVPAKSAQQQQQQHGRCHQQATVVNGARRNVYRTNSRRRYDLTPAVRRCAVTDKTNSVTGADGQLADDTDAGHEQPQTTATLFSRRYVINLDPLTPRTTADQLRPSRGTVLSTTGPGKTRWQRQQTTYQLTPRALRTPRSDVSAAARLTTRRAQTMTDENFLSATGKKLLDGSATSRNGQSCRVTELNLNSAANTQTQPLHASDTGRRHHQQRTATTALSLQYSDSADHGSGIVLPQLATHR